MKIQHGICLGICLASIVITGLVGCTKEGKENKEGKVQASAIDGTPYLLADRPEKVQHVKQFLLRIFCMVPEEYWKNGKVAKWVAERSSHSKWDRYIETYVSVHEQFGFCTGQIYLDGLDQTQKKLA